MPPFARLRRTRITAGVKAAGRGRGALGPLLFARAMLRGEHRLGLCPARRREDQSTRRRGVGGVVEGRPRAVPRRGGLFPADNLRKLASTPPPAPGCPA